MSTTVKRVLPNGCTQIVLNLAEVAGIIVEPGGFTGLFRERADLIFQKSVAVEDLWRDFSLDQILEARTPASKLNTLESLLQKAIGESAKRSDLAEGALRFLKRPNASVRECAQTVTVSERRLSQKEKKFPGPIWRYGAATMTRLTSLMTSARSPESVQQHIPVSVDIGKSHPCRLVPIFPIGFGPAMEGYSYEYLRERLPIHSDPRTPLP